MFGQIGRLRSRGLRKPQSRSLLRYHKILPDHPKGMSTAQEHKCKKLVLDAGPLLSLSPLRGLANSFFTVPQVLSELKDSRARAHFERLGLMSGVKIEVRSPDPASLSHGT